MQTPPVSPDVLLELWCAASNITSAAAAAQAAHVGGCGAARRGRGARAEARGQARAPARGAAAAAGALRARLRVGAACGRGRVRHGARDAHGDQLHAVVRRARRGQDPRGAGASSAERIIPAGAAVLQCYDVLQAHQGMVG